MEQYIKKSAIEEEIKKIEKLSKDKAENAVDTYFKIHFDGWVTACRSILSFLDTLEVKEEPVSEDLEKAAGNYAFTMSGEDEVLKYYVFKAGANWQKEHLIGKMEQFLYEELSNGDIECRDMKFLIEYLKSYMKENKL